MAQFTLQQAIEHAEQLRSRGDFAQAEKIYRQILAQKPNQPFILNRLGICLGEAKRYADAIELFHQAIALDPKYADAWANLSLARERSDDLDGAIDARRKAIELAGDSADAHHRLGTCLGKKGDFKSATEHLQLAIKLNPRVSGAYHDLQLALVRAGNLDAAEEAAFRQIKNLSKVDADSLRPLADGLKSIGQFERATNLWKTAIAADPLCDEARGELAMCLITLGDYENGWRLYETRWDCGTFSENTRRDPNRQWGRDPVGKPDLAGRTILIYSEQGIGDRIMFARYAALLQQRDARVIVECRWPIKSLLESCTGVRLVYATGETLPKYDWHIPMLSLPLAFETRLDTIPANIPYLKAEPMRRERWGRRIAAAAPTHPSLRVGLTWAGNPRHKNDARRSIHPDFLAPLAEVQGTTFFSLQKANENEKAAQQPDRLELIDFTASFYDFADTAALIDHLDLVICADTAVAHLAGAMGKEVWTLLPYVPDFRWGLVGDRTPWYPTMRLFRQSRPDDWEGVLQKVAQELKTRAPAQH